MADNVFSFSTKTEYDRDLILQLKKEFRQKGKSFSHFVVEAIKEAAKATKGAK